MTHSAEKDAALETEWGVRFPSGAVQSYGSDESSARRFALATTTLRPDLPTLVVRQVVTPWEVPHDCESCADCLHGGKKCCGCYDGACCALPTGDGGES